MSRWIDADHLRRWMIARWQESDPYTDRPFRADEILNQIDRELSVNIVRCKECGKSHIDGKTTHYLWCTEWGRSTDTFGYCERGEREGE